MVVKNGDESRGGIIRKKIALKNQSHTVMWIREQNWGDSDPKLTPFDSDSLSDLDFFKKHEKNNELTLMLHKKFRLK